LLKTPAAPTDDLEAWYRELVELGPARYEPGERDRVQAIFDDADAQAKAVVRKSCSRPPA
jgi:hypothetical protein